jgi:hypothetical protein
MHSAFQGGMTRKFNIAGSMITTIRRHLHFSLEEHVTTYRMTLILHFKIKKEFTYSFDISSTCIVK